MFKIKKYIDKDFSSNEGLVLERIKNVKKDISSYVYPNHDYDIHWSNYANLEKGVEMLMFHGGGSVAILVDVDVDGYTSASMMKNICEELKFEEIHIIHHENKLHGLYAETVEKILETNADVVILPDSSSNDMDEIVYILKYMDVIVIDHHDISNEEYYDMEVLGGLALINNQSKSNIDSNPHLTGAGMCLRFIECVYDRLGKDLNYRYYDWAMMGLVGDMADYSDYEVRNIVFKGLEHIHNKLLQTTMREKVPNVSTYVPMDIAFNFNPFINAVTRVGTMEQKALVFHALSDNNNDSIITEKRRRKIKGSFQKVDIDFTYYEYTFDIMENIKSKQDRLVKKLEVGLYDDIHNDGGVAIGLIDESYKGITGLVANRVASTLKKPTLLLRDGGNVNGLTGSGRGFIRSIDDFKTWCNDTDLFEFAEGHDNAFGVGIREERVDDLIECTHDVQVLEKVYYVDEIFTNYNPITYYDIMEFSELNYLTGGSIPNIKLALKDYTISKKFIQVFDTVTKIDLGDNIELVIFNDNGDMGRKLTSGFDFSINIDVVGKPNINTWLGKTSAQIIVDDIKIA